LNTLPANHGVPVQHLAQIFESTTTSYKYLWFKAILHEFKDSQFNTTIFKVRDLTSTMLAYAWYSTTQFKSKRQTGPTFPHLTGASNMIISLFRSPDHVPGSIQPSGYLSLR
jgi:hypothetical protein